MTHSFLQPAPAPGRDAPATAPAQPAPGPLPDAAQPPGGGGLFGGASSILILLLPLLLIFLMTRSQTKKQKQIEASLKAGDRVVTQAGLIGRLVEVGDRTAKLEIAPGVNIQILKSAIQGLDSPEPKPAEAKKDAKDVKDAKDAKDKEALKDKPQEKKA